MTHKYLLVYRSPAAAEPTMPSPAEMQAVVVQWQAWKKAFPGILDLGDGLLPSGKRIKQGAVTDGPSIESKEMVAGYSLVAANDYDAAVVIAKECPILKTPGSSIEVRQLAGY